MHNEVCAKRRLRRLEERRRKVRLRQLWRGGLIFALTQFPHVLRIQAAWRGLRARRRAAHCRELKRRHDALEDAEVAAAREKALARRRLAEQSREARQRELPARLPSHAASTLGNHGKKDGKDRTAVRSVLQAQEHADWTSETGRQSRTRHGEQTKAEAHAAAVARKREQKRQAERQKEIDAGKREAERLERWRLENRTPKSVDEALNEAAAYARAREAEVVMMNAHSFQNASSGISRPSSGCAAEPNGAASSTSPSSRRCRRSVVLVDGSSIGAPPRARARRGFAAAAGATTGAAYAPARAGAGLRHGHGCDQRASAVPTAG